MTVLRQEELLAATMARSLADRLVITPMLDPTQIGPASIDVRLATEFIELHRLERGTLDPIADGEPANVREERVNVRLGEEIILHPGQFILGSTLEFIRMPTNLCGEVLNRSSWARVGLLVATAVFVQPGYRGVLTLELVNVGAVPMRLRPGLRIAQLVVFHLDGSTGHSYESTGKYSAPLGPQSSKLTSESAEWDRMQRIGERLQGPLRRKVGSP